ncbi:unnamed protein product [Mytilus edulis]|uniref:Uncharacterized protein n=1 Tax=Mytilus edulis TaxID=6550 RepID=A0A8S3SMQ5_MYTED|nr:unnamed protein product [Mytilus edulis]
MCFIKIFTNAGAECTFPSDLRGSWISADKGILTFTPNTLSDYNIQLSADISSVTFDCNNLSNNQYYLRGNFLFNVLGSSYRPHICLEFYKVTSEKFYYYIGTDIETTINDRIYVDNDVNNVTRDDVCNRHKPFEVGTYVMLIKDGASDTNLSVICPSDISGNFQNVRFSASDGTNSCSGKNEDKTLKATIYPGSCRSNQTATYVSSPGVLVQMEIPDVSGGHTIFTGVAIGISVAVIVLVCIISVTVFIRRRYISKTTVDNALDHHDIAPSEYPINMIDDKILYSQVSKGIRQHDASEDTQSPYSLSEKGVYDHTNERRHVVTNTDVYSHAVDTVYDSSEQHTRQDQREEIYDHVFGQKVED